MTLNTTTSRVNYPGTGSVGPFAFPFRILADVDLLVIRRSAAGGNTVLALATDYTVSGAGSASGSITLVTALAVGETLIVRRRPALTQPTSIRNQGSYFPATIEDEFDRLTMQLQSLQDSQDRSLKLNDALAGSAALVEIEPTAGYVIIGTGTGFTMSALDAGAIAIPGAGRTVATLSAYLANNVVFNWKDFGAVGNGVADDTTKIQAATVAAVTAHGKSYGPSGTYKITASIVPTTETNGWSFEGDAAASVGQGTVIKWAGAANGTMMSITGCRWVRLRNVVFDANNIAGIGIRFRNGLSGAPHAVASNFTCDYVVCLNTTGSPGVSLYFGEGDATPGISDINLNQFESWSSTIGIYCDNGGMQCFRMRGGTLIGHTYGIHAHYASGGDFYLEDVDFANNAEHVYAESGSVYNLNSCYAENGILFHWGNHNGQSATLSHVIKVQSAGTPAIIKYDGGTLRLKTQRCSFPYGIDIPPAGSNDLTVHSEDDIFTTGGWTKRANTFIKKGNKEETGLGSRGWTQVVVNSGADVDAWLGECVLLLLRDVSVGGSALIAYENGITPTIVWQDAGAHFTVAAPGATALIQVKNRTGNGGIALRAGTLSTSNTVNIQALSTQD
jgi:hypothetical protein